MKDARILKDILYGEFITCKRNLGGRQIRYRDVCKWDMKEVNIDWKNWEEFTMACSSWRKQ